MSKWTPPVPKEKEIKKAIVTWLNLQPNTFAFVVSTVGIPDFKRKGGFRTNPNSGISDIIGCKNGKFFAFEVKRPGGELSDKQRTFLMRVFDSAGCNVVVTSLDEAMKAYGQIYD